MKESSTFKSRTKIMWQIIDGFEVWGSVIFYFTMAGLVNLSIILRITTIHYGSSAAWEEIARFSSVWLYMIGVAIASKEDSHLRAGIIKIKSLTANLIFEILRNLISLICIIIFAWWSVIQLKWVISVNQISMILRINIWVVYLSFSVCSILAAIHNLNHLMKKINQFKNLKGEEPK